MKPKELLFAEIFDKYGEWIEMAGENTPDLMIEILSSMVIKEREKNEFYKLRIDYEQRCFDRRMP